MTKHRARDEFDVVNFFFDFGAAIYILFQSSFVLEFLLDFLDVLPGTVARVGKYSMTSYFLPI
jgi:hypothetical protein